MKNILFIFMVAILSSLLSVFMYKNLEEPQQIIIRESSNSKKVNLHEQLFNSNLQRSFLSSAPTDFISSASKSTPSVVYIIAEQEEEYASLGRAAGASGSGVIISPDGYIVTNNHVVEDGSKINVTLNNNKEYAAEVIGTDPNTDLALLKIEDNDNFPYLFFGNSDSLRVGEWVLAVGNPFKLQSTVTAGIVSAKGRDIDILQNQYGIESFIQTDAAVNPGNSGGALVNTNGELVGINTAIMTYSGKYEGYSFAIPANLAKKIIHDLREFGAVHRGLLGIIPTNIDDKLAKSLGLDEVKGVYVQRVSPNGGADEAGLQSGDIIKEINNSEIADMPALLEILGQFRPGDTLSLSYMRDQKSTDVDVVLKNQMNTTDLVTIRKDKILLDLGFEIRDLLQSEKNKGFEEGVKVHSIYKHTTIDRTNMEPGFIITKINGKQVTNVDMFLTTLKKEKGKIELEGKYESIEGPWMYVFRK